MHVERNGDERPRVRAENGERKGRVMARCGQVGGEAPVSVWRWSYACPIPLRFRARLSASFPGWETRSQSVERVQYIDEGADI